jgi:hypothetical protein
MKSKIKYEALDLRGNRVFKTVTHDFPDFTEQQNSLNVNGKMMDFILSVDAQCMEYLDNLDKTYLMYDNDWQGIISYSIVKPKQKSKPVRETVVEMAGVYLSGSKNGNQLLVDFLAAYSRLYKTIKTLKAEKQFKIVIESMNIGYDTSSLAYQHAILLLKSISDPESREKLKQFKEKNNGNQLSGPQGQS